MYKDLKRDLRRIRPVLRRLEYLRDRLALLEDVVLPAGPVLSSGGSGSVDAMERRILDAADCEAELRSCVEASGGFLAKMERVTGSLERPELALLVELRYYKGLSWGEIASALHYSEPHVYKLHSAALACMLPAYLKY